jgi:uncharacterized protein
MTGREMAWRVFANELLASKEEERGVGEKIPSYVISPLGGRMNRVVMAGTVTPADLREPTLATEPARALMTDPTGTVTLAATAFQPQGQKDLKELAAPTHAVVVGKVTLSRGAGAFPAVTVRAEAVSALADGEFRALSAEIALQTLERLELVSRLRNPTSPPDDELLRSGVPLAWVRGARASITRYPALDATPYYRGLRAALAELQTAPPSPALPLVRPEAPPETVVRVVQARTPTPSPSAPAGLRGMEGRLLEILDELAEGSPDGYADMDELAERAARHGLDGERMEEVLNYLSENGTLEEPLVGKFRRAEGPPPE